MNNEQIPKKITEPISTEERWAGNEHELIDLLKLADLTHLSSSQLDQAKSLVIHFKDIFSQNDEDIGCCDLVKHKIVLDTDKPIRDKYRNIPLAYRKDAEKEVQRLLDMKIIVPSSSPYHSPSFLVSKPDGSKRIITDYRKLNEHVVRSFQPLPSFKRYLDRCPVFLKNGLHERFLPNGARGRK